MVSIMEKNVPNAAHPPRPLAIAEMPSLPAIVAIRIHPAQHIPASPLQRNELMFG
jgi:hypothetical protein